MVWVVRFHPEAPKFSVVGAEVALMGWPAIAAHGRWKGLDHPESGEGSIPSNAILFCLGGAVGEARRTVNPFPMGE